MNETDNFIHSRNLKEDTAFPYLVLSVENDTSVPLNPGFRVMHWHEDLQFIYVSEGTICVKTLEEEEILSMGEGVFINKGLVHMVERISPCRYKSFVFPEKLISFYEGGPASEAVRRITEDHGITLISLYETQDWCRQALGLLRELAALESGQGDLYCYEVLTRLSALWLILAKNAPQPAVARDSVTIERTRRCLQTIEQHYAERITLRQLAESVNVSVSECLRCFRATLQTTPYRYLMDYRLSKAGEMLRDTTLPVSQIAGLCGFGQPSYFGKCFREKMGCSPREYRMRAVGPGERPGIRTGG